MRGTVWLWHWLLVKHAVQSCVGEDQRGPMHFARGTIHRAWLTDLRTASFGLAGLPELPGTGTGYREGHSTWPSIADREEKDLRLEAPAPSKQNLQTCRLADWQDKAAALRLPCISVGTRAADADAPLPKAWLCRCNLDLEEMVERYCPRVLVPTAVMVVVCFGLHVDEGS